MKIALGQINMYFEDKKTNYVMIEEFVSQAHDNHADLIIFPEMSCTGFSMNTELIGETNHETEKLMMELSRDYHIKIMFGQVLKNEKGFFNNFTAINGSEVLFSYNKIHPFTYEANYYQKGNQIISKKIDEFIFSPFICYDLRFPEIFQMASKKSQIIIVIASWPERRNDHWLTLLKARAIENQCYVIGVNRVGYDKDNQYIGHSCVFDSNGKRLTRLSTDEENIYLEIHLDDIEKAKQGNQFKKDRREDLYLKLMSGE